MMQNFVALTVSRNDVINCPDWISPRGVPQFGLTLPMRGGCTGAATP